MVKLPRGRGGQRQGVTGKAYQNRTDLNGANVVSAQPVDTGKKLPVATASGQPYGAATVQKNAQQQVGMAGTQTPTGSPLVNAQPQPTGQPIAPVTPLDQPTTHGLPVTTGVGGNTPGAGTEALQPIIQFNPAAQALQLLNSLGDNVSPQVEYVRNFLIKQTQNQMPQ